MKKIKVGAVSYLNTKPLLYGIKHHPVMEQIELIEDFPARVGQMLIDDKIDLGLVPVAVIPLLKEYYINTDFGIGADGMVASVCIFSEVPMDEIESVILDNQSRTSVTLARILLKEYWKKEVQFINSGVKDYRQQIKGSTAAVVIGDRALEQRRKSKFIYDLGLAWKKHTGFSFVFAAWISNKKLPAKFIEQFNNANGFGLQHLDAVIRENPYPVYDLKEYFTKNIQYSLPADLHGLQLFLEKMKSLHQLAE